MLNIIDKDKTEASKKLGKTLDELSNKLGIEQKNEK